MMYGWTAPAVPVLKRPDSPVPIEEHEIVWLETLLMLGGLAGLPVTIFIVDFLGRKPSILLSSVVSLVSWMLVACANRIEYLYVARFINGLCGDVAFVATPMYIGEIAEKRIRGILGGLIYIMMLVGMLVVYCVTPFVKIWVSSLVAMAFIVFQLATFVFMPESPYYLLMRKKHEEAAKSLQWFRNTSDVEKELQDIMAAVERQQKEKSRPQDLFLIKSNRKAITIMAILNGAQHFSSISVMLMNLHSILQSAGSIYMDDRWAGILFAAIMLVAAILAVAFVDRVGRKILLTTSATLTGISLALLASYFAVKNSGIDTSTFSWIPIVSVMVYAAAFKAGMGIIPIILTGELFPTSVKAMGMTVADSMYVIFAVTSLHLYGGLQSAYGLHVPFFIFAGSCLFTAIFCAFFLPETKGKTLEEIQMMLKGIQFSESERRRLNVA